MGLDVSFDRAAALAAGLQIVTETNGTLDDIARAKSQRHPEHDPDYYAWLTREEDFVIVPFTGQLVHDTGFGDIIMVRANKWGQVYYPLTRWLSEHNITWDEG